MKISTSFLFDRATERMSTLQNHLATTQSQLSVSKQILSPSDAPEQAAAITRLQGQIDRQDSHSKLLKTSLNRYKAEETALRSANDLLIRLKELGVQAANDVLGPSERKAVGVEMQALRDQLVSLGNTQDDSGNYLFSGTRVRTAAFGKDSQGHIIYQGDQTPTQIPAGVERTVQYSRSGTDVFSRVVRSDKSSVGFFDALDQMINAVNSSNIPHLTVIAFMIGAVFSISTVAWSVKSTPELPLTEEEIAHIKSQKTGIQATLAEIADAIRDMPSTMRQLWWMKLFQWYAMMCYWIYIVPALALSIFGTRDPNTSAFRDASLLNGQIGGFYNFVAFIAAFALMPLIRKWGPKHVHALCLSLAGISMMLLPSVQQTWLLFVPMVGVGLAWASIMGNPYILLAGSIPKERAGVYMGIFNMFIVLPMIFQMITLPFIYTHWLDSNPTNVIVFAGVLLCIAALLTLRIQEAVTESV